MTTQADSPAPLRRATASPVAGESALNSDDPAVQAAGAVGQPVADLTPRPITWRSSATDGRATGRIPEDWCEFVEWRPKCVNPAYLWLHKCDPAIEECPNPERKELATVADLAKVWAFDVYYPAKGDRCIDTDARQDAADGLEMMIDEQLALKLHEQLIEHGEDVSGGKCPGIEGAVGLLFARRKIGAVLHIPDIAVGGLVSRGLIRLNPAGDGYLTIYNQPAVVSCVPNIGPDGEPAAPGTAWLWVSGPVDYAISEVQQIVGQPSFAGARQNDIDSAIAESKAIVRVDPWGIYAVCVTLPNTDCPQSPGG